MTQALTITHPHNRPHQTFRVGYDMPAMDIRAGEAFQRPHYAAVRSRLLGRQVSLSIATPAMPGQAMGAINPGVAPLNMLTTCSWRFLVALAAVRHGLPFGEVMRRSRQRHIIAARTEAICLIYRHTQYSMPGVGRIFELDHTSILNALIKTGSTDKLVEVLPHMDTAKRSKNRAGIVLATVEAQHA